MIVTGGIIPDATGIALLARILGNGGEPIGPADVSAIAWTLTDTTNGLALAGGTFAVAGSVFAGLVQTDLRWSFDSSSQPGKDGLWGYNFAAVIPATALPVSAPAVASPLGPARVQCDVAFTMVGGQPFRVPFTWVRQAVYG